MWKEIPYRPNWGRHGVGEFNQKGFFFVCYLFKRKITSRLVRRKNLLVVFSSALHTFLNNNKTERGRQRSWPGWPGWPGWGGGLYFLDGKREIRRQRNQECRILMRVVLGMGSCLMFDHENCRGGKSLEKLKQRIRELNQSSMLYLQHPGWIDGGLCCPDNSHIHSPPLLALFGLYIYTCNLSHIPCLSPSLL